MSLNSYKNKAKKLLQREVVHPVHIPVMYGELLTGKTVLITGGTGGLGQSIAEACINNGATVVLAGRNEDKLIQSIKVLSELILRDKQKVIPMQLDIGNVKSIRNSINETIVKNNLAPIDILVNNAGIQAGKPIGATDEKDYDKTLDTNLKGTYFMAQEFSNYLIENEIEGNILNVASVSGIRPAVSPYMLSKWGIIGLTEGLAKKLIKHGIVVNGIAPGPTATKMLGLDGTDLYYEKSPAKRYTDPKEIANLAVIMISDLGRMVVGDVLFVSGGCGNLTTDDISY